MSEIHVGDTGTVLRFTVLENGSALDISTATTKEIILRKPDRTTRVTKTAAFTGTGSDGRIQFVTLSSDFDIHGMWKAQARLVFPGPSEWKSSVISFEVFANV